MLGDSARRLCKNGGGGGVRADDYDFLPDYRICPPHLRVAGPEDLSAARGLRAGELRVAWNRIASVLHDDPVITVVVDDGTTTIVHHVPVEAISDFFDSVPRGRDLEITVALTRQQHVVSDIIRIRIRATQTRTGDRPRPPERVQAPRQQTYVLRQLSVTTGYNYACWLRDGDNGLVCESHNPVVKDYFDGDPSFETVPPTSPQTAVDMGEIHGCSIQASDDHITCWGSDRDDVVSGHPADLGPVTAVAAGLFHSCAMRQTDGSIRCWGDNSVGQTDIPSDLGPTVPAVAVSAGRGHTCGIRKDDDRVVCWGMNYSKQLDVPANLQAKGLGVGERHSCAVRKVEGTVVCWGRNTEGQSDVPANLGPVLSVSGGEFHTCALRSDYTIRCWGSDAYGQISTVPAGAFVDVNAGSLYSCGRRPSGTVECWWKKESQSPAMSTIDLSSGTQTEGMACGIRKADGELQCWGYLGPFLRSGTKLDPRWVLARTFKAVSASQHLMCAIKTDDTVTCWGSYWTTALRNQVQQTLKDLGKADAVSAYEYNGCAIRQSDDKPVCWRAHPWTDIALVTPPDQVVKAVALGQTHACAIAANDEVVCWGSNSNDRATPPATLGAVTQISAGKDGSCAIRKSDQKAVCWGYNSQAPQNLGTVTQVASGDGFHCARKTDGTVACWGQNDRKQTEVPANLGAVKQVAAGKYPCAIRSSDETVRCWGTGVFTPP